MTREEKIINEAKKYYSGNIQCYDAFLHGTEFADKHPKNVWHDVSEIPEEDLTQILYQDKTGTCWFTVMRDIVRLIGNWEHFAAVNIRCWAYIRDLLPKGGEK